MNGGAAASPPQALLAALQSLLQAMSVAMLAAYFVLILMQVFYRFVINDSLFWAEELVRGLLVWGVMIGSVLVARARGHIRVEILETMVPAAWRRAVLQLNDLLSMLFCLLLLFASIQLMDRVWHQLSPMLEVPKWTVYMALAVGPALEALIMVLSWNQHPEATQPGAELL